MANNMPALMRQWYLAMYERLFEVGTLGRTNADGSTTVHVPNRPRFVYVETGAGETTGVVQAMNIGVPNLAGTPVRMLKLERLRLIVGLDWASPRLAAVHADVAPHEHVPRTGLGGAVSLGEPAVVRVQGGLMRVPPGTSNVRLLPESGSEDNLDAILDGDEGQLLLLATGQDGVTITVRGYNNAQVAEKNIDMRGSGNNRVLADVHDNVLLVWRAATGHWEEAGPLTLNQLIGVVVESPSDGQALVYDADTGNWINETVSGGGGPGAGEFLDLDDTPSSYSGAGGRFVVVNDDEDALDFTSVAPGGGAEAFTELDDAPSSYSGQAGKLLAVNGDEDALEFANVPRSKGVILQRLDTNMAAASGARTITFDTVAVNDAGWTVDAATGVVSLPEAGWYAVSGHVRYTGNVSGFHVLSVRDASNALVRGNQLSATSLEIAMSDVMYIPGPTDITLELFTGNSATVMPGAMYTYFTVVRLA